VRAPARRRRRAGPVPRHPFAASRGQRLRIRVCADCAVALSLGDALDEGLVPPGQRPAHHAIDVGVRRAEFGRALVHHAAPSLGVGDDVGDHRADVSGESVVGTDARLPQLRGRPVHRVGAVGIEGTHEQRVLVAEGAVQAALAESRCGSEVVDRGRGVTAAPELVTGSLQHGSLVELPWPCHEASVQLSGIFGTYGDLWHS
jgi:hypothetical protein